MHEGILPASKYYSNCVTDIFWRLNESLVLNDFEGGVMAFQPYQNWDIF